jgi:NAD(P)-dependent dehydrogenase (short-subunit alcohol dehydrogenase family)
LIGLKHNLLTPTLCNALHELQGLSLLSAIFVGVTMPKGGKIVASKVESATVDMAGRKALVVGGTSGIGRGIARRLAVAGADVTIAGRSEKRGDEVLAEMRSVATHKSQTFSFAKLDCFNMTEVQQFGTQRGGAEPLDYLVMTQGMATTQGYTPTESSGLDQKLTLHYFSRVSLARSLVPALEQAKDPRVLSVLSAGVHGAYSHYAEDFDLSGGTYSIKNAADAAGFYNDIALDMLSREHTKVSFVHAAPGFVATNWGTEMPFVIRKLVRCLQVFGRSKEDCGEYMFKGLHSPRYGGGGLHLLDQYGEPTATKTPQHDTASQTVWDKTKAILARFV